VTCPKSDASGLVTLKRLLEKLPEYADLPIAVLDAVGELHYLNRSGTYYVDKDHTTADESPVLVFTGN
jgi:hypothetical protein